MQCDSEADSALMCTERERQLLSVLERKLSKRLRIIDDETFAAIRATWAEISPVRTCPSISAIMPGIKRACAQAVDDRGRQATTVISDTLSAFPGHLSPELISAAKESIEEQFPANLYLGAAQTTAGVFQRKQAPANKFSERYFRHEMSIIEVGSYNSTSRAIESAHTCLDELAVLKSCPTEPAAVPQTSSSARVVLAFWQAHWKWIIATAITIVGIIVTL